MAAEFSASRDELAASNFFEPPLCQGASFASLPAPAVCSAFLIEQDVVATAGHCVDMDVVGLGKFRKQVPLNVLIPCLTP